MIRKSFSTVAREFGLTRANCPSHPAFVPVAKLRELQSNGVKFFGVYLNGEEVGFVAIEKNSSKSVYFMEKLAVVPLLRHRGYGRHLVEFTINYVKDQGGKKLSIAVIDEHTILKEWYKKLGFKEIETKKFKHLPFTVCYMEKKIT